MFDNIGGKIKALAATICWAEIVAAIISGIALCASGDEFIFLGIMTIILGPLIAWASALVMYGFGELVENSGITNSNLFEIHKLLTKLVPEEAKKEPVTETKPSYFSSAPVVQKTYDGGWRCKKCGTKNSSTAQYCKDCGTYK